MHDILVEQLEKINYTDGSVKQEDFLKLLEIISSEYYHMEEDCINLKNRLAYSSKEMKNLNIELKEKSKTTLAISEAKYRSLAKYDTLTGIPNRLYLEERLEKIIHDEKESSRKFAILFLDLDYFKQINDTLGHNVGDKLLQEVSSRILPNIGTNDIFARVGGDKFVIVLMDIQKATLLQNIEKFLTLMRKVWTIDTYELNVSTSIGVSVYPDDGNNVVELLENADTAMYRTKDLGRNNFSFFTTDLYNNINDSMKLQQEMFDGYNKDEFELYYHPKNRLIDDTIIGAEALIRWNHPTMGLIYPDKFIELSESTGFILKLGTFVISEGCKHIAKVNKLTNTKEFHLSVNISIRQLQRGNIFQIIKDNLEKFSIDPSQFYLEITENIISQKDILVIEKLNKIRALGVKICMDDFGAGYSTLSTLDRLPIDSIKIDKSFIDNIPQNEEKNILIDSVITMTTSLGIKVLAEGVEEEYQKKYLIEKGCLYYQGYLFSKPLREDKYLDLIKKQI